MLIRQAGDPRQLYARVAGISYIITIFLGIFSVNFAESTLIIPGNDVATVHNIIENEALYRVGIASEILMYVLVILLAGSLYIVLKSVDKNLAMLALLWRIGEAIIGSATTVVSGLIPIWLIKNGSSFEPEQFRALLKMFLDVRGMGLDVVLIFIGVGGTIYCYLFLKSEFVPRILAVWGVVTYLTMLILSFASVLAPVSETMKMVFYAPGGIFELTLGFWLLLKGVSVRKESI